MKKSILALLVILFQIVSIFHILPVTEVKGDLPSEPFLVYEETFDRDGLPSDGGWVHEDWSEEHVGDYWSLYPAGHLQPAGNSSEWAIIVPPNDTWIDGLYDALISPTIDLTVWSEDLVLCFGAYVNFPNSTEDTFLTMVSPDNGSSWFDLDTGAEKWVWGRSRFGTDVTNFRSSTFRVAFVADADVGNHTEGVYLDNVYIYGVHVKVVFDDNVGFFSEDVYYVQDQTFEVAVTTEVDVQVTMNIFDPLGMNRDYWIIDSVRIVDGAYATTVTKVGGAIIEGTEKIVPPGKYQIIIWLLFPPIPIPIPVKYTIDIWFSVPSPRTDPDTGKPWTPEEEEEYRRGGMAPKESPPPVERRSGATLTSPEIRKELDKILKDFIETDTNHTEFANKIRKWIGKKVEYEDEWHYDQDLKKFLKAIEATKCKSNVSAICAEFAYLLVSLLRKAGIPARIVEGENDPNGPHKWNWHWWVEFWCGEKWLVIDATMAGCQTDATTRQEYGRRFCYTKISYWGGPKTKWVDVTKKYKNPPSDEGHSVLVIPSTERNEYLIGENVTINVNFTNVETIEKTITYNFHVVRTTERNNLLFSVLNTTDEVSIPAENSLNVSYDLSKADYVSNGHFVVIVTTNETARNETSFQINGGVSISAFVPAMVDQNQDFNYFMNITNILPIPVNDLNVSLSFPYFASIPSASFVIPTLLPRESWHNNLSMRISESANWTIGVITSSAESGYACNFTPIKVLSPPLLEVRNDLTPQGVVCCQQVVISSEINNLGDYQINDTAAMLELFGGVSTTDPLTKTIGNLLAGETKTVNWTVRADATGTFLYTINAVDQTDQFKDTNYALIFIGYGPTAIFTEDPETPYIHQPVTFNASMSKTGFNGTHECPITEYHWNFGDGNKTTTTNPIIHRSYETAGIYNVTLTVYAPRAIPENGTTTHIKKVVGYPYPPVANFTQYPEKPKVYEPVYFDASTSQPGFDGDDECPITEYHWDFGDSTSSTGKTVRHIYDKPGNYTVTLTVYAPGISPYIDPQYVGTNTTDTTQHVKQVIPVGGYSFSINTHTTATPPTTYFAILTIIVAVFTAIRRKTHRKTR